MKRSTLAIIICAVIYTLLPAAAVITVMNMWGHEAKRLHLSEAEAYPVGTSPKTITVSAKYDEAHSEVINNYVTLTIRQDSSATSTSALYAPQLKQLISFTTHASRFDITLDYNRFATEFGPYIRPDSTMAITIIVPRPVKIIETCNEIASLQLQNMDADSVNIATDRLYLHGCNINLLTVRSENPGCVDIYDNSIIGKLDWTGSDSQDPSPHSLSVTDGARLDGLKWDCKNPEAWLETKFNVPIDM